MKEVHEKPQINKRSREIGEQKNKGIPLHQRFEKVQLERDTKILQRRALKQEAELLLTTAKPHLNIHSQRLMASKRPPTHAALAESLVKWKQDHIQAQSLKRFQNQQREYTECTFHPNR
jgi:hypothetical protein